MNRWIYQVDAFTNYAYGGNPAGVLTDGSGLSTAQMQKIAMEMSLSETAFVIPGKPGYDFEVRFFTPTEEVDLCGHATIATFHQLKALGMIPEGKKELIQKTKAGLLTVRYEENGSVLMRQADPQYIKQHPEFSTLAEIMGTVPGELRIPGVLEAPETWSTGLPDIMLPVSSVALLKSLQPNMGELAAYSRAENVTGVHAFALDESGEVWCRNFAPACGIPEEAATGTSNGALGACLHHHGWKAGQPLIFTAHQGDWMGRPSRITVSVLGAEHPEVWVGGHGVTVLSGEILIPEL